jgi:hypothetical protein
LTTKLCSRATLAGPQVPANVKRDWSAANAGLPQFTAEFPGNMVA